MTIRHSVRRARRHRIRRGFRLHPAQAVAAGFAGAILAGTLLLSTLPLALIGGITWWIRRRARDDAPAAPRRSQPAA